MGPEILAAIAAARVLIPELVQLIDDIEVLSQGGEIPSDRLREYKEKGNVYDQELDDLIARKEAEGR